MGQIKEIDRTVSRRTKFGCFCCRKRKIKCDGQRPQCQNCIRSSYVCVWPQGTGSLPHGSNFKPKKLPNRRLRFVGINCTTVRKSKKHLTIRVETESNKKQRKPFDLISSSKCYPGTIKAGRENEILEDCLFRRYLEEVSIESNPIATPLNGYSSWIPGFQMSPQDAFFYNAFVRGFMVSVSPQLAHKSLQPGAIFIPPGWQNPILMSVFYACGAAFLCGNVGKDMNEVAEQKYEECLNIMGNFIDHESIVGNEHWLLVALLCFCLREKYHGEDATLNTCHLVAALEIIRLWQGRKRKDVGFLTELGPRLPAEQLLILEEKNLKRVKEDSSHSIIQRSRLKNATMFHNLLRKLRPQFEKAASETSLMPKRVSPAEICTGKVTMNEIAFKLLPSTNCVEACDRTLIESFLYNYSINLFICNEDAIDYLASPFEVFPAFRDLLSMPIYDCAVPWMNNPVMGASLTAFEIAGKTNWLGLQYPLNANNRRIAVSLMKSAKYYAHPILPPDVKAREPVNVQRRLMESCYVGDMVARASFIYLKKMLNPELNEHDREVMEAVERFNSDLYELTLHSQVSAIASWPFAIVGSAAIKKEHQIYIRWRAQNFCDVIRSEAMATVLTYLDIVWGKKPGPGGMEKLGKPPGIEALLDRRYHRLLFI